MNYMDDKRDCLTRSNPSCLGYVRLLIVFIST